MQRLRSLLAVALVAVGFTCFAGGAQASGKAAKNTSDWKLMGAAGDVKAGGMYTLVNVTDGESIRYGDRRWGVNIVWDKSTKLNNVKLDRKGGAGPLKYGDVVGLYLDKGGYVHYQKVRFGPNLSYSKTAIYEYVVLGGTKGATVKTGQPIGLYNTAAKDFLIYGERPIGINLRWWGDRELAGGFLDRAKGEARRLVSQGFNELADEYLKKDSAGSGGAAKEKMK